MRSIKVWAPQLYQHVFAAIFGSILLTTNPAEAEELNAGAVLTKMTDDQRASYVSGVIEGLAYSRYVRDKPSEEGMKCIYDWFYSDNKARWVNTLFPAFNRYKDKPVGVILHVLTRRACGE